MDCSDGAFLIVSTFSRIGCSPCDKVGKFLWERCPFEHVVVDIVGPFPRAMGYKVFANLNRKKEKEKKKKLKKKEKKKKKKQEKEKKSIFLSSRYPEAVPLKTATANVLRSCYIYLPEWCA